MDHQPPRPEQPYAWDDERLSAYLDGELSAPEQAQLEARLVVDPELRQLVDELRAVRQQLEVLPEYRLKPSFAEQVLRRAEQEMLLASHGRDGTEATPSPTVFPTTANPTATIQPVVAPQPASFLARRWQRGAIWTAVAAAAALLLFVTNRPPAPDQVQLARHDHPETQTGAATQPSVAAQSDVTAQSPEGAVVLEIPPANKPQENRDEQPTAGNIVLPTENERLEQQAMRDRIAGNNERESPSRLLKQSAPPAANSVGDALRKNDAVALSPSADAAGSTPEPRQLAHDAARKEADAKQALGLEGEGEVAEKLANGTFAGKGLLKSQALAAGQSAQGSLAELKEIAKFRADSLNELAALLASDDFSRLATAREDESADNQHADQVLVVRVTPRAGSAGQRSFEALLASNSIKLTDKQLHAATDRQRENMRAAVPVVDPQLQADPLPAATELKKDAPAKDRRSADKEKSDSAIIAKNVPARSNAISPVDSSDVAREIAQNTADDLYYLEADAAQIDELLVQLRSTPEQFVRLQIEPQMFSTITDQAKLENEKSNVVALGNESQFADKNAEDALMRRSSAPASPATPVAEAPGSNSLAIPRGVRRPSTEDSVQQKEEFYRSQESSQGAVAADRDNGRERQQSLHAQPGDDRMVTAYRLRGTEGFRSSKIAADQDVSSRYGGSGGGGAAPSTADPTGEIQPDFKKGNAKADEATLAEKSKSENPAPTNQPFSPLTTPSSEGLEKNLEQQSQLKAGGFASPAKSELAATPKNLNKESAQEFADAKAGDESAEVTSGKKAPAEVIGRAAAPPAKRVRVLFVIEHEPVQE